MCRAEEGEGVLAQSNGTSLCQGVLDPVLVLRHQRCMITAPSLFLRHCSDQQETGSVGIALLLTAKPVFSGDRGTCHKTCYNTGFNKIHLINPRESQFEFSLLVGLWHWKNIVFGFF